MSAKTKTTMQSIAAWLSLALSIVAFGTVVYRAGAMGERIEQNTKDIERVETQTLTRLGSIETKLDRLIERKTQ